MCVCLGEVNWPCESPTSKGRVFPALYHCRVLMWFQARGLCVPAGSAWRSLAALHPAWLFSLWALGPRCRAWTWSWWAVATACRWSRRDSPQVTLNTLTRLLFTNKTGGGGISSYFTHFIVLLVVKHSSLYFAFKETLWCNFFWTALEQPFSMDVGCLALSVLPSCFQRNVFVFKAPSTDLRTIQLIFNIFFLSVMEIMRVLVFLSFCGRWYTGAGQLSISFLTPFSY